MAISYGDLVVCAAPGKQWYGWIGVVRGKNQGTIGIEFEEDAAEPPTSTGRWIAKAHVVPVADVAAVDASLQAAVARFRQWTTLLSKARESAVLAVETYNRPTALFRTGAFASLMIIAWTSLLLAILVRRGDSPYEVNPATGKPKQIDGEDRFLGVKECIASYFPAADCAITGNLELFIRLRNKIEHADVPGLDEKVFGEVQAFLRNFERTLVTEFGRKFSINPGLTFPVTFSYAPAGTHLEVLRAKTNDETQSIFDFIDQFRKDLPAAVLNSQEYSFRVFLLPRVGNQRGSADAAVKWIDVDTDDPEAVGAAENLVAALLKVKQVQVQNLGRLKPGQVSKRIRDELGVTFNSSYHHPQCCRSLGAWKIDARPSRAEDCDARYCVYDEAHNDVVYTEAWVRLLLKKLAAAEDQEAIIGARLKPA